MGNPRLGCNEPFPHHQRTSNKHLRSHRPPCCPPTEWRESAINAHLHSRSPRAPSRCQKCPHYPWPCIALPPIHRYNVQCWLYPHLHQDWMLHHVSWPHYCLWPQIHAHWPLDGPTPTSSYKYKHILSHKLPRHTCNGCQCQGHVVCHRVCPLHPSTPVLPANIYPNLSAH
jgi:hypothetical protein